MQLYVLDYDPARAVQFLADVHVIKMCLETVQILSGVIVNSGGSLWDGMPRPYNPAHPVIRAIDTPAKLNWILLYNWLLQCEFLFRFHKRHAWFDLSVRACESSGHRTHLLIAPVWRAVSKTFPPPSRISSLRSGNTTASKKLKLPAGNTPAAGNPIGLIKNNTSSSS